MHCSSCECNAVLLLHGHGAYHTSNKHRPESMFHAVVQVTLTNIAEYFA